MEYLGISKYLLHTITEESNNKAIPSGPQLRILKIDRYFKTTIVAFKIYTEFSLTWMFSYFVAVPRQWNFITKYMSIPFEKNHTSLNYLVVLILFYKACLFLCCLRLLPLILLVANLQFVGYFVVVEFLDN